MSVTSNERMAPELSQFIIDKYQNMDASKQKEFLGIINEINATYAPFKRRTAILLRELVALTDARLIDEFESIKKKYNDVVTIKLERDLDDEELTDDEKNHITEVEIDEYEEFDYEIGNKDLKTLKRSALEIVRNEENYGG